MSIGRRVALISAGVMLLTLLALSASALVGLRLADANRRILILSMLIKHEEALDMQQRDLRSRIGATVRRVERGEAVEPSEWTDVSRQLDQFTRTAAAIPTGTAHARPAQLRNVDRMEMQFAKDAHTLIATAKQRQGSASPAMPDTMQQFVTSLNALETARADARRELAETIKNAADQSLFLEKMVAASLLFGALVTVALVALMTWWMRIRMIKPVAEVAHNLRALGRNEPPSAPSIDYTARPDEIGDLARGLTEYLETIEQRREVEARFEHLAHHDPLTNLANRIMLEDQLSRDLAAMNDAAAVDDGSHGFALLACDLDGFKAINDAQGHAAGDAMLRTVSAALVATCRQSDLIARIGGDEFVIVQRAAPQPSAAINLANRAINAIADATQGAALPVGISIGIAFAKAGQSIDDLRANADIALYRAKAAGINSVQLFDDRLDTEMQLLRDLRKDVRHALEKDQFYVALLPVLSVKDRQLIGHEAQLRWRHDQLGDIDPALLMPILDESGAAVDVGRWHIKAACAALRDLDLPGRLTIPLSVTKCRHRGVEQTLTESLQRHGLRADRIEIAVSEVGLARERRRDDITARLAVLRALGVRILLDDYGAPGSALDRPQRIQIDGIRLDSALCAPDGDVGQIRNIVAISQSVGVPVYAKGVRIDPVTLVKFDTLGCVAVQGNSAAATYPPVKTPIAP